MKAQEELRDFVQNGIANGHYKNTIFRDAYKLDNSHPLFGNYHEQKSDLVSAYFENPSKENIEAIPPEFHLGLQIINDEFERAKFGMQQRECSFECNLKLINERYALDIEREKDVFSLYIYDLFFERKQRLKIVGNLLLPKEFIFHADIQVFDSEYFLFYAGQDVKGRGIRRTTYPPAIDIEQTSPTALNLLKLDLTNMQCTIVDQKGFNGFYFWWLLDEDDSHKFVCYVTSMEGSEWNSRSKFRRGRITNETLQFDDKFLTVNYDDYEALRNNIPDAFPSFKLKGNKIQGVFYERKYSVSTPIKFYFIELNLEEEQFKCRKICDILCGDRINFWSFYDNQCLWYKNVFYSSYSNYDGKTLLHKFDLDSRTGSTTKTLEIQCSGGSGRVDNGILTLCGRNNHSRQHLWWRIALDTDEPEKLYHFALKAIRRHALFLNAEEFQNFVEKMPVKLRPFGGIRKCVETDV